MTFQFALTNGGPASIFYGSILAGIGACAVGFSLAELASMYVYVIHSRALFDSPTEIQLSVLSIAGQPISLPLRLVSGAYCKVGQPTH